MKKLITLSALFITFQMAFAQHGRSVVNLRLSNNAPLKVFIDGQQAADISNRARIVNLTQGRHFIQVYQVDNSWGYEVLDNAFRGPVEITGNTESFVTIDLACGKLKFDRIVALEREHHHEADDYNTCHYPKKPIGRPVINSRPVLNQVSCDAPLVPCGPVPMNAAQFGQLKAAIDNGNFESTRLNILKQALPYNYFTTAQVRELMDLFWFESSKLEVAKLAYSKTVDQQNYYAVNNSFSFSSSVHELGEYIAMR